MSGMTQKNEYNNLTENRNTTANIGLPQWGLTCFYGTFVVKQSAVLRLNFCTKNPPLRQAENRWASYKEAFLNSENLRKFGNYDLSS